MTLYFLALQLIKSHVGMTQHIKRSSQGTQAEKRERKHINLQFKDFLDCTIMSKLENKKTVQGAQYCDQVDFSLIPVLILVFMIKLITIDCAGIVHQIHVLYISFSPSLLPTCLFSSTNSLSSSFI